MIRLRQAEAMLALLATIVVHQSLVDDLAQTCSGSTTSSSVDRCAENSFGERADAGTKWSGN